MIVDIIYPTMQLYNIRLTQPQDNFGYRPLHRKSVDCKCPGPRDKKRPTKWVRSPSQRDKDERRIGWKKKKLTVILTTWHCPWSWFQPFFLFFQLILQFALRPLANVACAVLSFYTGKYHFSKLVNIILFCPSSSLFPHPPDVSWALLSTDVSSLLYGRTAGSYLFTFLLLPIL